MKIKLLFFLPVFLLCNIFAFGQCSTCSDSNNAITDNGNGTFTAASAQEYYWEICIGSAIINGSNTSQTVSVSATTNYRIKLVRFSGGSCTEACEIINIPTEVCPSGVNIFNEGAGGLCTTGLANLLGIGTVNDIDYVKWTWALGGNSGSVDNGSTTTPIYYPSGDWTNYYLVVCATAVTLSGQTCDKVCNSLLLDCGTGPTNSNSVNSTEGKQ